MHIALMMSVVVVAGAASPFNIPHDTARYRQTRRFLADGQPKNAEECEKKCPGATSMRKKLKDLEAKFDKEMEKDDLPTTDAKAAEEINLMGDALGSVGDFICVHKKDLECVGKTDACDDDAGASDCGEDDKLCQSLEDTFEDIYMNSKCLCEVCPGAAHAQAEFVGTLVSTSYIIVADELLGDKKHLNGKSKEIGKAYHKGTCPVIGASECFDKNTAACKASSQHTADIFKDKPKEDLVKECKEHEVSTELADTLSEASRGVPISFFFISTVAWLNFQRFVL